MFYSQKKKYYPNVDSSRWHEWDEEKWRLLPSSFTSTFGWLKVKYVDSVEFLIWIYISAIKLWCTTWTRYSLIQIIIQ